MKKILLILICMILLVGTISAFEFDNIKEYNQETKTATIKNAFGLGDIIAEVYLDTPEIVYVIRGEDRKVAEFTINNYENYFNVFNKIEFYNIKKSMKKIDREFKYKYKKNLGFETINDYKNICEVTKEIVNGSNVKKCHQEIIGNHQEEKFEWVEINSKEQLPKGKITIGIFTDVKRGDKVEWIPTLFGVKIKEWAIWEESLNVGLQNYYQFDETSGSTFVDEINGNNLTEVGTEFNPDSDGLINYAVETKGTGGNFSSHPFTTGEFSDGLFSINFYTKIPTCKDVSRNFLSGTTGNKGVSIIYETNGNLSMYVGDGSTYHWFKWDEAEHSNSFCGDGDYHQVGFTFNKNGANATLYIDGSSISTKTLSPFTLNYAGGDHFIGKSLTTETYINIDEFAIWNITLSDEAFLSLWNGGNGIQYGQKLILTPILPEDNANFSINAINLSVNISDPNLLGIQNVTLNVYNATNLVFNETNSSGFEGVYNFSNTFIDGSYNWNVTTYDNVDAIYSSSTRSFNVDITPPEILIHHPINDSNIYIYSDSENISGNATITDNIGLHTCWVYNETANYTFTCGENVTLSTGEEYNNWTFYANDSAGNSLLNQTTFFVNYIRDNSTFESSVLEGTTTSIYFNLTATNIDSIYVNLSYNGTIYPMTEYSNNGSYTLFGYNVSLPSVTEDINMTFFFNYLLNGDNFTTQEDNQTIKNLPSLVITSSSCSEKAIHFNLKNEENFAVINGTLEYNFLYGNVLNSSIDRAYGKLNSTNSFYVCINSSVSNIWVIGEGEISYQSNDYLNRKYYLFEGMELTNSTQNITLYNLENTDATSFLFSFQDGNLFPYIKKYISLLRWYPSLNKYNVVEMGKTDDKGQTIMRVKSEDVNYRVGLYELNGTLIKLLNPVRFACLSSPCTYSTIVQDSTADYISYFGVESNIVFNETTNIWTYTWNDPSQNTNSMRLLVTRERGDNSLTICDTNSSGFTGILTCNSTGYTGILQALAFRTASPETPIAQRIIQTGTKVLSSPIGLFISLILFLLLALIGVWSPVASIILGLIGLIPALFFGSITFPIFIGIGVLAGLVIHFMKRAG